MHLIKLFKWKVIGLKFFFDEDELAVAFEDSVIIHRPRIVYKFQNFPKVICEHKKKKDELSFGITFESKNEVLEKLRDHILKLFGTSNLIVSISSLNLYQCIPVLKKAIFYGDSLSVAQLEEFIDNHSHLEALMLDNKMSDSISPKSHILSIKHLNICDHILSLTDFFKHFKGESAFICAYEDPEDHLQKFIRNWLDGKSNGNLKYLHVRSIDGFTEELLEPFEQISKPAADKLNGSKKLKHLEDVQYHLDWRPCLFQLENDVYIERECDEKKAFIEVDGERDAFVFCVWEDHDIVDA